ncbi:hypothetical protein E3E12_01425 [Formicincola oecophyllae]|uniref:5-methylcytosine-specific restriction enzyme subunit McrC n=1 Tax=Formicincola oecophyllae TaxID=2558361 RepID=A0A4Y6U9E7_9PROT|nr:hypothetical protein [Formicincola oecophyllae]QDH13077.1 hypothetical protein E3E12_01425 [Formicincola oecophyllae]
MTATIPPGQEQVSVPVRNLVMMLLYQLQDGNLLQRLGLALQGAEENAQRGEEVLAAFFVAVMKRLLQKGLAPRYQRHKQIGAMVRGTLDVAAYARQPDKGRSVPSRFDALVSNSPAQQLLGAMLEQVATMPRLHGLAAAQAATPLWRTMLAQGLEGGQRNITNLGHAFAALPPHQKPQDGLERLAFEVAFIMAMGLVPSGHGGTRLFLALEKGRLHDVYEKFLLAYFKRHHGSALEVRARHIPWSLQGTPEATQWLPRMQTDMVLADHRTGRVLIVDAKFYTRIATYYHGVAKLRSAHLYQVNAYRQQWLQKHPTKAGDVSTALLYAQPSNHPSLRLRYSYPEGGKLHVNTVNLDAPWGAVTCSLDAFVADWLENA